jgi:hypothetical protein
MDDLTVYTRNRAAEARCRACQVQQPRPLDEDDTIAEDLPEHTCRRPPTVPQATRAARAADAHDLYVEQQLAARRARMAEINARA